MLLITAALHGSGLYAPLLSIVNSYAWESHMDEKWKVEYTKVIQKLHSLRPVPLDCNQFGYITVSDWHLVVLLHETRLSFLITGRFIEHAKGPYIDEGKKHIVMYHATRAKFESWCSSVSNWKDWRIILFIDKQTDWQHYPTFRLWNKLQMDRYNRHEHFIM